MVVTSTFYSFAGFVYDSMLYQDRYILKHLEDKKL